ncbi:hypothetical protein [Tenacibaculum jejuense]|nr:hypothetical protein [Tenacibaculum jejuense]
MKKVISTLGKSLNKSEQKTIQGGTTKCSHAICRMWEHLILKPACSCDA